MDTAFSSSERNEPLSNSFCWLPAPDNLSLGRNVIHAWRVSLDAGESRLLSLAETLSADEQARASRFHFRRDRDRYVVARGTLREILGTYLGVHPSEVRFTYTSYGKPFLAPEYGDTLRFNMSHSHKLALYGFAIDRQIGIDVEMVRSDLETEEMAQHYFSAREVAALRTVCTTMQRDAFFDCWTRKEAYVKARGEGLSIPLDQFDVSFVSGEPARLLDVRTDPREALRWSMLELDPGKPYKAAVVFEGGECVLSRWTFQQ